MILPDTLYIAFAEAGETVTTENTHLNGADAAREALELSDDIVVLRLDIPERRFAVVSDDALDALAVELAADARDADDVPSWAFPRLDSDDYPDLFRQAWAANDADAAYSNR